MLNLIINFSFNTDIIRTVMKLETPFRFMQTLVTVLFSVALLSTTDPPLLLKS